MKYKYFLFDLDGTVSESAEGIRYSLESAIKSLGAPMPNLDDYTLYIGPPLLDTFRGLCGLNEEQSARGVLLYRDVYNSTGKYKNRAYRGVGELLRELKERGARLAICTSKYEPFAEEIIELIGLKGCFDAVCGSTLDGSRKDKKDLIPYAAKALGADFESEKNSIVMIGDTYFDARGARLCGVDFIGVKYGYGEVEKMRREGAGFFADRVEDILTAVE